MKEVVPGGRIELPTRGFSIPCSTTELPGHVCGNQMIIRCIKELEGNVQPLKQGLYKNISIRTFIQWRRAAFACNFHQTEPGQTMKLHGA